MTPTKLNALMQLTKLAKEEISPINQENAIREHHSRIKWFKRIRILYGSIGIFLIPLSIYLFTHKETLYLTVLWVAYLIFIIFMESLFNNYLSESRRGFPQYDFLAKLFVKYNNDYAVFTNYCKLTNDITIATPVKMLKLKEQQIPLTDFIFAHLAYMLKSSGVTPTDIIYLHKQVGYTTSFHTETLHRLYRFFSLADDAIEDEILYYIISLFPTVVQGDNLTDISHLAPQVKNLLGIPSNTTVTVNDISVTTTYDQQFVLNFHTISHALVTNIILLENYSNDTQEQEKEQISLAEVEESIVFVNEYTLLLYEQLNLLKDRSENFKELIHIVSYQNQVDFLYEKNTYHLQLVARGVIEKTSTIVHTAEMITTMRELVQTLSR